jgi:translation initiation factor 2B subunit (eIF-2B alpha/beta/delta family)
MRSALAILLVLCVAGTMAQESSPVNEDDRLGILGKENSKQLIQDLLNLKFQVGNNTARIKALNISIQANAATDAILQAKADANAATIAHQASLVTEVEDAITDLIEVLQNNFTLPFAQQLVESVSNQVDQITSITASLDSLGRRRLHQAADDVNSEDRLLAPITIETAKKCEAELVKLGAAVLKNNQSVYELSADYDTNEVDIATLEATVAQNQANITALVSRIEALRNDLEQRQSILIAGTLVTAVVQNITGLGATKAINGLLDVASTQTVFPVNSGSLLPNTNVDATCPTGDSLIGGSCEIVIPDGLALSDLAPYITNGGGTQMFASLSFPLTEDYTNNLISCTASVDATDGTTQDTNATWAGPFTLQYRAEALCYSQRNITADPFNLNVLSVIG